MRAIGRRAMSWHNKLVRQLLPQQVIAHGTCGYYVNGMRVSMGRMGSWKKQARCSTETVAGDDVVMVI